MYLRVRRLGLDASGVLSASSSVRVTGEALAHQVGVRHHFVESTGGHCWRRIRDVFGVLSQGPLPARERAVVVFVRR